jgi:hypothetical protein
VYLKPAQCARRRRRTVTKDPSEPPYLVEVACEEVTRENRLTWFAQHLIFNLYDKSLLPWGLAGRFPALAHSRRRGQNGGETTAALLEPQLESTDSSCPTPVSGGSLLPTGHLTQTPSAAHKRTTKRTHRLVVTQRIWGAAPKRRSQLLVVRCAVYRACSECFRGGAATVPRPMIASSTPPPKPWEQRVPFFILAFRSASSATGVRALESGDAGPAAGAWRIASANFPPNSRMSLC